MTEPMLLHDTEFEFVRLADIHPWAVDDTDTGEPYRVYSGNRELGEVQFEAEDSTWSAAPNTPGAWRTLGFANELHAARFLAKFMEFSSGPMPVVGRTPPELTDEALRVAVSSVTGSAGSGRIVPPDFLPRGGAGGALMTGLAGAASRRNGPAQDWPSEMAANDSANQPMNGRPIPQVGQRYRHFKGGEYKIHSVDISLHRYQEGDGEGTALCAASTIGPGEIVVAYQGEDGRLWMRSLANFLEVLGDDEEGTHFYRFQRIS